MEPEEEPILSASEACVYCGKKKETIHCFKCGKEIKHVKNGLSIEHRCFACNVDDGKGE